MVQEYFPNCSIGADVIVGYPGETEDQFMQTYKLLKELPITHFHVFPYSKRKNTTAAKMEEQIQAGVKKDRVKTLIHLGEEKKAQFAKAFIGGENKVLFEREKDGLFEGYTSSYIRVAMKSDKDLSNTISDVYLSEMSGNKLIARPLN